MCIRPLFHNHWLWECCLLCLSTKWLTFPSGELHKRTDIIKSLMRKVKTLESNQAECQTALQKTQQQLQEMAQKATHSTLLSEDLEVGFNFWWTLLVWILGFSYRKLNFKCPQLKAAVMEAWIVCSVRLSPVFGLPPAQLHSIALCWDEVSSQSIHIKGLLCALEPLSIWTTMGYFRKPFSNSEIRTFKFG